MGIQRDAACDRPLQEALEAFCPFLLETRNSSPAIIPPDHSYVSTTLSVSRSRPLYTVHRLHPKTRTRSHAIHQRSRPVPARALRQTQTSRLEQERLHLSDQHPPVHARRNLPRRRSANPAPQRTRRDDSLAH